MAKTNDALKILERMIGDDADMRQMIAKETLKAQIARLIYEARTTAGLMQQALAARVGTKPSVIARLEDADVDSDALFLLHCIAAALGLVLDMRRSLDQSTGSPPDPFPGLSCRPAGGTGAASAGESL